MFFKIFVLETTLILINKITIFLIWIVPSFPSLQPSWFNYFLDPVNQLCSLNCFFPITASFQRNETYVAHDISLIYTSNSAATNFASFNA